MDKKFEFKLNVASYTTYFEAHEEVTDERHITEVINNQFGTWVISTARFKSTHSKNNDRYRFFVFIDLITSFKIDMEALEKIKFEFTKTPLIARKFPGKQSFEFTFDGYSYSFMLKCSVDASSLPLKVVPFSTLHDYNEELFESGKSADVTIKTMDGKEIKAHSWMLVRSKVFDAMLNKHETKESREKIINIEDVDYDLMLELIRFIYCDKVPKLNEMAKELLALADRYEVPALVNACGICLIEKEDIESIADILITADNMKIEGLKQAAVHFAVKNRLKVMATQGWKRLKETHKSIAIDVMEMFFGRE